MSQVPWTSHSLLLREVSLKGWLVNVGPLRVGSGRETLLGSPVDLAVLRVKIGGRSAPYIPGSSLKGVFRTAATQLARMKGLPVCSGLSRETCMDYEYAELGGETLLGFIQDLLRNRETSKAIETFHGKACLLCKIFGAPSFTGHVVFEDAYPVNESGEVVEVQTGVRAGIAINRRTGSVHGRALYQVEYVEPGARFRFAIRATNLPNYALGLLARVLRMMNDGWVKVGGFKTRGFGEVRVEGLSFSARGVTVRGGKLLAVDGFDEEVDLSGIAEARDGWLTAPQDRAWSVLERLEGVWDRAKLR